MSSTFAVLDGHGTVTNVVLLEADQAETFAFLGELVDVTELDPRPGPGWTREGESWAPAPDREPDPVEAPEAADGAPEAEPEATP